MTSDVNVQFREVADRVFKAFLDVKSEGENVWKIILEKQDTVNKLTIKISPTAEQSNVVVPTREKMAGLKEHELSDRDEQVDSSPASSSNSDSDREHKVNTMNWMLGRLSTRTDGVAWRGMVPHKTKERKHQRFTTSKHVEGKREMKPGTAAANVHEIDHGAVQDCHNVTGYRRGIGRGKKPPRQTNPHSLASFNESASPKPGSSWFPTSGPSISSSGSQCGHSMAVVDGRKRLATAPTVPVVRASTPAKKFPPFGRPQTKPKRVTATVAYYTREEYEREQEALREMKQRQHEEQVKEEIRRVEVDTDREKVNRDAGNGKGDE
ncbi:unnamed protein product [Orchesella dallaii]|uniref:Uncharacterized protein n=1 Tax=Orchesella dallaii TaxID=48710 RepID=A0ABP1RRL1_9HEXA